MDHALSDKSKASAAAAPSVRSKVTIAPEAAHATYMLQLTGGFGSFMFSSEELKQQEMLGFRRFAAKALRTPAVFILMSCVICLNVVVVVLETDYRAKDRTENVDEEELNWVRVAHYVLLVVYTIEICLRIFAYRRDFFSGYSGNFDLGLVVLDILVVAVEAVTGPMQVTQIVSVLKVLRLGRVIRIVRFFDNFCELSMLIRGMASALRSIFWASVMIGLTLTFFGIIFVEFVHPIVLEMADEGYFADCGRCRRAYSSVFQAVLTFTQNLVAGDSWGEITVPIIERNPMTGVLFAAVMLFVQVGLLNLVLAVIVDRAAEARMTNEDSALKARARLFMAERGRLLDLCQRIDTDCSGYVEEEEMVAGFENDRDCAVLLRKMGITGRDIRTVFSYLATESEQDGHVTYKDFVERLYRLKSENRSTQLICDLQELRLGITKRLTEVEEILAGRLQAQESLMKSLVASMATPERPAQGMAASEASGRCVSSEASDPIYERAIPQPAPHSNPATPRTRNVPMPMPRARTLRFSRKEVSLDVPRTSGRPDPVIMAVMSALRKVEVEVQTEMRILRHHLATFPSSAWTSGTARADLVVSENGDDRHVARKDEGEGSLRSAGDLFSPQSSAPVDLAPKEPYSRQVSRGSEGPLLWGTMAL